MRGFNPTAAKRIKSYANGGVVRGPGTGTSDDVQATIAKGSYIMPADSTKKLGADALGELGQPVPVNLSNGEYQMPPEQVHAVGLQALNQIKDATHAPVGARGFNPERRTAPASGGARGFNPKAAKAVEPRMFFAGGGSPAEEELKRAEQKAAAAPAWTSTPGSASSSSGADIPTWSSPDAVRNQFADWVAQKSAPSAAAVPGAPTQPANTGGASGSWGSPAQPQSTATQPTPPSSSARGFAPGMQSVLSGGMADAKASASRGDYGAAVGHGLRAGLAMVPAAADDALRGAAVVLNPAANALKTAVTGDSTPIGSVSPTSTPAPAAAPKVAPTLSAAGPGPSIDRIAPASNATAPGSTLDTAAAPAPAAPEGSTPPSNQVMPGVYQHGRGQYSDSADGMGFSRGFPSGPSATNLAAADALAARSAADVQGMTARGFAGWTPPAVQAPQVLHSGNSWQARTDLRNAAVSAGSLTEQPGYGGILTRRGFVGGVQGATPAQQAYQSMLASDQAARAAQNTGEQTAMRENAAIQRTGMQEQGATGRNALDNSVRTAEVLARGFDARRKQALDERRLGLEEKAQQPQIQAAQRQEALYQRYQNAKTPEERNAIAQQIRDLKGTAAPASWKAVALQGGTDAMGNKTEGVLAAVNEQTGEVRRLDSGQGGAKEAAPTEVGQRKAGTVYSLPNGKLGRWTSQGWELVD